ncbi:Lysine histidine transporter-like 8 [Datura stramonium]|uniref:Lysine histidine transporter-like 8 n=1 Tax=Datura stramonium TaxID=4076 RepID=A0ABS8VIN8_DATST|nr:Lysine histidine transporter-like 8 [Datura stramonium]
MGIIAFTFRGLNLVLEIQATMPSTFKHPAHVPMWKGAKVAYFFIAMYLFPIAWRLLGLWKPYAIGRNAKCTIRLSHSRYSKRTSSHDISLSRVQLLE